VRLVVAYFGVAALDVAANVDELVAADAAAVVDHVVVVVVAVVYRNEAGLRVRLVPFVRKPEEHFRIWTCVSEDDF